MNRNRRAVAGTFGPGRTGRVAPSSRWSHLYLIALLGILFILVGCPSEDDDEPGRDDDTTGDDDVNDDDTGDDDADHCDFSQLPAASIDITERSNPATEPESWVSRITAQVNERPDPDIFVLVREEGGCRYYERTLFSCEPPCGVGEVCTIASACEPYPAGISAGTLTIEGLGEPIVMEGGEDWNPGYYYVPWDLPDELFDAGDPISATFSGDVFPAVSLEALGVGAMDTDLAKNGIDLINDQDAEITWTPGSDPDVCIRLLINSFGSGYHGAPPDAVIWCEGNDSGSVTVPGSLINEFPPDPGCPELWAGGDPVPSTLSRYSRDILEVEPGPAILMVRSTISFCYERQL